MPRKVQILIVSCPNNTLTLYNPAASLEASVCINSESLNFQTFKFKNLNSTLLLNRRALKTYFFPLSEFSHLVGIIYPGSINLSSVNLLVLVPLSCAYRKVSILSQSLTLNPNYKASYFDKLKILIATFIHLTPDFFLIPLATF